MTKSTRKAFTLIELLIVVAIIAILAAIAVPNFLEAQTRAKVSRVYSDFRTLATALEAYAVDNKDYPSAGNGGFIEPPDARLRPLTTPIAYITKVLVASPFLPPNTTLYWDTYYQYTTLKTVISIPDDIYLDGWYTLCGGNTVPTNIGGPAVNHDGPGWLILDRGPDQMYFYDWVWNTGQTWSQTIQFYDPTNGTISEGEIVASQMKGSNTH